MNAEHVRELVGNRKTLPPQKPGSYFPVEAGTLYVCDPYCEKMGQVFYVNPRFFEDGLQVSISRMDLQTRLKDAYLVLFGSELSAQINSGLGGGPLIAPAKPGVPSKSGTDATSVNSPGATGAPSNPFAKKKDESAAPALIVDKDTRSAPAIWLLRLDLDLPVFGGRYLSTSSNTQINSDSPFNVGYGAGFNLRVPALSNTSERVWFMNFYTSVASTIYDQSSGAAAGSGWNNFTRLDVYPRFQTISKSSQIGFGGLIGYRQEWFSVATQTPFGFNSTRQLGYVGILFSWKNLELDVRRSLLGGATDADQYRGTSVSADLTEINARMSWYLGNWGSFLWEAGFAASIGLVDESGSGTPSRAVFTSTPSYMYVNWNALFQFSISRAFQVVKKEKKKGFYSR